MWQEQDDPARPLPFRFSRNDELIDYRLRAIHEIAELRLPQAKQAWVIERVSVIEAQDARFRKRAVVNADARLLFRQMHERDIWCARFRVVKNRVSRAECATGAVLPRQPHRRSFEEQ